MYDEIKTLNINSDLSKKILNNIIDNKEINYKKLNILFLKKKIQKLKKDYLLIKNKRKVDENYKLYFFWEILKKKYKNQKLYYKKRNQFNKLDKVSIHLPEIGKALGFNPSLLFLLLYKDKVKNIILGNEILEKVRKAAEIEELSNDVRLRFIDSVLKKKINLITPLCPDYEHIQIAPGLYKYTFNNLGEGVGLIGKRLITILDKLHKVFDEYKIKYSHHLLYGDFESYSIQICKRLSVSEKEFQNKLNKSVRSLSKHTNNKCKVGLLVDELSNKKDWKKLLLKNEAKIKRKFNNDIKYRRLISQITQSRSMLYSSWFPNFNQDQYKNLVIKQGAEYSSMGDLFNKKFNNPIIVGLDHPKMKNFYNLNNDLAILYGKTRYV